MGIRSNTSKWWRKNKKKRDIYRGNWWKNVENQCKHAKYWPEIKSRRVKLATKARIKGSNIKSEEKT